VCFSLPHSIETIMTDEIAPLSSGWHLLAEFALETELTSVQRAAELVEETIQPLNIQAAMLERIQRAVIEALQGMLENEKHIQQNSPIRIRILVSGTPDDKEGEENDPQQSHNWGFFLLERQRNSSGIRYHRLELFVYRETE
jgi:hypothetical protein